MSPRLRRQMAQSLIEVAVAVPVLAVMLYSTYSVGVLASNRVASGHAVRAGARLSAELGNGVSSGLTHDQVDKLIVKQVMAVASALDYATVSEIDIYPACVPPPPGQPCHTNQYRDTTSNWDRRTPAGAVYLGQDTFLLAQRDQLPPSETSIGVTLVYTYSPPITLGYFTVTVREWAVMKAAPVFG